MKYKKFKPTNFFINFLVVRNKIYVHNNRQEIEKGMTEGEREKTTKTQRRKKRKVELEEHRMA
jgi:hypothetical protein